MDISKTVIVTDWGEARASVDFDNRYRDCRKKKDGGLDLRFKAGREMHREEEALIERETIRLMKKWVDV